MAKAELNFGELGGATLENLWFLTRGTYVTQTNIIGKTINQYKYIKLLTQQEVNDMTGRTDITVSTSSLAVNITNYGSSSVSQVFSISTAPTEIASKNIADNDVLWIGMSTGSATVSAYGILLYND